MSRPGTGRYPAGPTPAGRARSRLSRPSPLPARWRPAAPATTPPCTADRSPSSRPAGKTDFAYPPDQRGTVADLSGQNLVGDGTLALSDYAGKVVVLNFWGSWCAPCRAEAPELEQAAAALAPLGVQFLGVNVRDTKEAGADFVTSKQVSYPSIYDPSMRTLLAIRGFPTSAIPSTIVIDKQGRVAHILLDPITDPQQLIGPVSAIAAEQG